MRSRSARRWSIAGAPSGSLSKTTARRAPPPSRETITCGAGGGGCSRGADHRGDAGWRPTRSCRRASCAPAPRDCRARGGRSRSARRSRARSRGWPRRRRGAPRSPAGSALHEAQPELGRADVGGRRRPAAAMAMRAIGSATGREEATRDSTRRQRARLVLARELARAPHGGHRAGEPQREPPSAQPRLGAVRRRPAVGGDCSRSARAAEQPRPEERDQRRDERDRHGEGDQRGGGEARAEGAEELQVADDQRRGPGGDDQAGGEDDRRDLGDRRRARRAGARRPRAAGGASRTGRRSSSR